MSAPADPRARSAREPGLAATVALYALARLGLLALIAALLLVAGTPFVIALLVALIVALPLSMLVFRGLRTRLDVALAAARARRGEERAALRARLRGGPEPPAGSAEATEDVRNRPAHRRAGPSRPTPAQATGPRASPTPVVTDHASSSSPVSPSTRTNRRPSAPPSTRRVTATASGSASSPSSIGQLRIPASADRPSGTTTHAA